MTQPASSADVAGLAAARAEVIERIARACARARRDPGGVRLVAVSKTVDPERLRAAVHAGLGELGENRVQEAAAKVAAVPGARWHLVGPLQSNKARRAVALFDTIQTVDSIDLGERLARIAGDLGRAPLTILLQVNVDGDPAKSGLPPDQVETVAAALGGRPELRVAGLMTVGRQVGAAEEARPTFRALRELSDRVRARTSLGSELSMGMTDDFEVAVEEGATIVRVGRALFGERPHQHGPGEDHEHLGPAAPADRSSQEPLLD
jgi:pyridoxal phosphate enzyme (YggS family)